MGRSRVGFGKADFCSPSQSTEYELHETLSYHVSAQTLMSLFALLLSYQINSILFQPRTANTALQTMQDASMPNINQPSKRRL